MPEGASWDLQTGEHCIICSMFLSKIPVLIGFPSRKYEKCHNFKSILDLESQL